MMVWITNKLDQIIWMVLVFILSFHLAGCGGNSNYLILDESNEIMIGHPRRLFLTSDNCATLISGSKLFKYSLDQGSLIATVDLLGFDPDSIRRSIYPNSDSGSTIFMREELGVVGIRSSAYTQISQDDRGRIFLFAEVVNQSVSGEIVSVDYLPVIFIFSSDLELIDCRPLHLDRSTIDAFNLVSFGATLIEDLVIVNMIKGDSSKEVRLVSYYWNFNANPKFNELSVPCARAYKIGPVLDDEGVLVSFVGGGLAIVAKEGLIFRRETLFEDSRIVDQSFSNSHIYVVTQNLSNRKFEVVQLNRHLELEFSVSFGQLGLEDEKVISVGLSGSGSLYVLILDGNENYAIVKKELTEYSPQIN